MFQSILSNLAIILLGHLLMSTLMNYRERFPEKLLYMCIVILFSGVIITMFYLPIQFGGYRLDLRLIPLLLLAVFRGWRITLPVLFVVSTWRYLMGGDGAVPGTIFGMILPTLFTLAYYKFKTKKSNVIEMVLIITVCWLISDFPILIIVPDGMRIFKDIFLLRYASFLGATFIYYSFILLEYKREALKKQLTFLAMHDPLTKLLNRNEFIKVVEEKITESHLNHYIAMIDIDHFKKLNDNYGHIAGDTILIKVSSIFKKYESDHVIASRYGGEEFIIYLGINSPEQGVMIINKIQNEIRETSFKIDNDLSIPISVSIGLAKKEEGLLLKDLIKKADKNLYVAKEKGRDRLMM
ncbi:GGDEF domain-containing protein [Schinkia azotoformans]|uniref:GGDEF domain-containing protein n=1 Tax=Schinkia azotoformans TaxID=1454 RepID=UPI002DBB9BF2|nr:GGDEF domain-containing protein [Schinkia azotoformans]MEC1718721.1 GGDEF domain-containing protein [Schinkia azotoformans]MEC1742985.1 GGDEF domain-containing protein [Schinkia azotoformans]MEC1747644.1 GGDEF domain-containing protein [Schinkia azotoformans]MEC1769432.1 GGDEF domain-containing protein [Schinkia azotoformans]MEC1788576.1 GGDEF domain-containing protein [Schinkia azotoformans]